jgi:hypothetical protein
MKNKIFTIMISALYPPIYFIIFLLFSKFIPLLINDELMDWPFVMSFMLVIGSNIASGLTGEILTNIYKSYDSKLILIIPFLFFLFLTIDTIIFNNIKQSLVTDLLIYFAGFGCFSYFVKDRKISKIN